MTDRSTTRRDRHRAAIRRGEPACHICGKPIDYTLKTPDPMSFEVDHVVPLAKGGADELSNKAAAHRRCNRAKHANDFAPIVRRSSTLDDPQGE